MMASTGLGGSGQLDTNNDAILFDMSKSESLSLTSGLKTLHRKLKAQYKIATMKESVTKKRLSEAKVAIFPGPKAKFTAGEFDVMNEYLEEGGNILITLGEGGEKTYETNVNFFLEQFNISINNDAVVRSSYYKYYHPKECVVSNGVLNSALRSHTSKSSKGNPDDDKSEDSLSFLYPFGATLLVQKPSVPVLSSGTVSLPVNRPICAFCDVKGKGRLVVLGSTHFLDDKYIDKEENMKVFNIILKWLTDRSMKLNAIDAEDPEISDYHHIPRTAALAEQLRVCLQEGDEIPRDFTKLYDKELFNIDTSVVPDAIRLYDQMNVPHEPLQLITPKFETPLPPLEPAVFPPTFREPEPPLLDLFDLDENFSSERVRLAQLANKCTDDDLEYFIRECGEILSVSNRLEPSKRDGKHILEFIFKQVVQFKKLNQD
eukprot:m.34440 g.34440  ORF g.34440 m.34440 type:complete len:431 (+) comp8724_c0_seq1:197-1489(+)